MKHPKLGLVLLAPAVFSLLSCDDSGKKHANVAPPPQAKAPTIAAVPAKPVPAPVAAATAPAQADAVGALITQVDKEYETGRANYAAGHLDTAKQNFDRAFSL